MAKQGLTPPFSQYDMVMVQWAFVGPPLLFGDQLGFNRMTVDEKALLAKTFFKVGQALGEIIIETLWWGKYFNLESHRQEWRTNTTCALAPWMKSPHMEKKSK